MHRITIFFAAIALLTSSCNDHGDHADVPARKDGFSEIPKTKEDSLYHDVMEGHDVGMAKIGKIKRYTDQVKRSLDSLNKLPAKNIDTTYKRALLNVQEELSYADFSMNKWMEEFKVDSATGNPELRIIYLQSEKEKVAKVKEAILGSLQHADSLFAAGK